MKTAKKNLRYRLFELVDVVDETGDGIVDFDWYDIFMMFVILISLIPLLFKETTPLLLWIDRITVVIFIIDYVLRWITSDYRYHKHSFSSFLRYPFSLMAIIDLLSIIPSLTSLNSSFKLLKLFRVLRTLKMLRTIKVLRVVRAARYSRQLAIIAEVLKESKDALLAVCTLAAAYIFISALIVFNVEPDTFGSFFDAIYWATVSLTTVGYGDISGYGNRKNRSYDFLDIRNCHCCLTCRHHHGRIHEHPGKKQRRRQSGIKSCICDITKTMQRESFQSRLGFLLVSAGCAIGIGNVWRFPYITGQNGGGIFVLFYLLFLIIMGMPVLTMELAVGRAGKGSAVPAYKKLEKPGSKWHIHGWFCLIGCYLLMMYYTSVCGWMISYFFKFLNGTFTNGMSQNQISGIFAKMLGNPVEMAFFMGLTVLLGFLVCSMGLQKGLERVSKYMMSALLVLIVVLAVHSVLLPGGSEGLKFYLLPSLARAEKAGWGNVISAAMNQSFFTLSLGVGAMEIFGSYMSSEKTLLSESAWICVLDTFVALMSGLIIFPACSAFGINADAGPSLIFITLPNVFTSMSGGRLWGALFFLFMTFASFSTVIAVFENLIACCIDNFGWTRKKACVINFIVVMIASLPCVFGFNIWKNLHLIGGRDVLDSEDFLVSNILLPGGSLVFILFCSWKYGWGFDNYMKEANTGTGIKVSEKLKPYFQFVLPVLVLVILIQGLIA